MRGSLTSTLVLLLVFVGCGGSESKVRWKDVESAQSSARSNPDSIQARQEYVDTLSSYLNDHPGDDQAANLFVEEELMYARSLTSKGRFAAAIPYFEDALSRSPHDDALAAELEEIRARIVVPRDRFTQLSRDMTKEQVRDLLGSPRPGWTHSIEKSGHTYETWYYKREGGGTASVGFVDDALFLAEYGEIVRLD